MTFLEEFGNKIKNARENLNMSQMELAKKVGYTSRSSIAKLEAGRIDPPQSKIIQLAEALDVPPTWLMGWDENSPNTYYDNFDKPLQRTYEQTKILANNIERLLKENDVTQVELARVLGVNESTVEEWVLGHNAPSMRNIHKIANYFKVPQSFILEENPDSYYHNPEMAKIAQELYEDKDLRLLFADAKDANPEQIKMIHKILKDLKKMEKGEFRQEQ